MSSEISAILSQYVDKELIAALMQSYDSIHKAYSNEDYENTLTKSGKFVENIFRILYLIVSGKKLEEIKQGQLSDIFDKLEKSDGSKFSDTIRVVIPRVGMTIYTMRSKLGSDHVKSTLPDFIDAKFVIASCDWIMAELLRRYHKNDPTQIEEMIQKLKLSKYPKLESFQVQLASHIDDLSIPDLVIIILRTKQPQTKLQAIQELKNIGKDVNLWMLGGNFNRDLIKKGYLQKVGQSGNEDLFSLTIRGTIKAEQLIDKIKTLNSR